MARKNERPEQESLLKVVLGSNGFWQFLIAVLIIAAAALGRPLIAP